MTEGRSLQARKFARLYEHGTAPPLLLNRQDPWLYASRWHELLYTPPELALIFALAYQKRVHLLMRSAAARHQPLQHQAARDRRKLAQVYPMPASTEPVTAKSPVTTGAANTQRAASSLWRKAVSTALPAASEAELSPILVQPEQHHFADLITKLQHSGPARRFLRAWDQVCHRCLDRNSSMQLLEPIRSW